MPEGLRLLPRSLRVRLLLWSATILVLVLSAFVLNLRHRLRSSLLEELDAKLRSHAEAVAVGLVPVSDDRFELDLPGGDLRSFQEAGEGAEALYYAVWSGSGALAVRSDPDIPLERPERPLSRTRDQWREVVVEGPAGALVLVGRGTRSLQDRVQAFSRRALGAAGLALVLALAGGWFLTTRALAPIDRISRVAAAVSASNLGQRIDRMEMETELGRLAETLNDTFDRLQAAFEQQTRFTSDASHELRTPLSVVTNQAELALRRDRQPEEYRDALNAILEAARRMRAVVEDLLTLARADAGELSLRRDRLDLAAVVRDTAKLMAGEAERLGVAIEFDLADAALHGDRSRLQEMVMNLLANAIRYNRKGGRVTLRVRTGGGLALLDVSDTGIGIPPEQQALVFDRFHRVDKARSREAGGSGLGLAISRWIAEAHGGRILLESEPGSGTTFRVELPAGDG
ncbi:MAG: HAMP domain-containing protein [Acidobacteria bacterium]|nr:HAMP domain-containing protein [Acidobacteriota bacterium]